ncbi:hypothetical protein [Cellulomonas sp. P24]|uniref:hypothetical protein n=1 Tax=Cellulomonas sp. P24 TaxID=2885206 RepID=UPI00216B3F92|nr:hypothetical protein [Cellulomonas sp. P24]MCR6490962.1 hypothetical protein [Cellulomonas sp. P24]
MIVTAAEQANASSWTWLEVYGPTIGFIGVLLAGWLGSRWRTKADHRLEIRQKSLSRFEESVELITRVQVDFREFTSNAPRGGDDPKADSLAGDAVDRILKGTNEIRLIGVFLRLVASPAVVTAYEKFNPRIDEYLREVTRQLKSDGVFRGKPAQEFEDDLDDLIQHYVDTLRADLGLRAVAWRLQPTPPIPPAASVPIAHDFTAPDATATDVTLPDPPPSPPRREDVGGDWPGPQDS